MELPKNEGNFEQTPAGTFVARCFRFVDLGSHEQVFQGESKGLKRLVLISFELPTELMSDGRPFTIAKRYVWSTHEKANLRKDLEAWRGQKFNERDFGPGGFDIRNVIGKTCTLTIVHNERDGSTYSNIASIGAAMKGMVIPEQINPSVYVSLLPSRFDQAAFDTLSDKIKETIKASPEWESLNRPAGNSYAEQSGARQMADLDDEIPF
jgi:hypothetical protein